MLVKSSQLLLQPDPLVFGYSSALLKQTSIPVKLSFVTPEVEILRCRAPSLGLPKREVSDISTRPCYRTLICGLAAPPGGSYFDVYK